MSEKMFSLIVGIVFLLFAIGHLARVFFGMSFVVQDFAVPMWASAVAVVIAAFLSYEGFHFSRK
jgi:hypothetical protein